MLNLKMFIIVFFSIGLITSNILSKSIFVCHDKTFLDKKILQETYNHKHCDKKKENKLVFLCFECDCNQNQFQLIVLSQSFVRDIENKKIITIINYTFTFYPNNLDPPPKFL